MRSSDARKKKKQLYTDKRRNCRKSSPPSLSVKKKGPCARLLPTVGVPKILPDRKFPLLRCILKSCSHPNAVTVILLTIITSLHPRSLSFILSLRPSPAQNTVLYLSCGAGLCWFTADNMKASSWDCVFLRAVIADSEGIILLVLV